MKLLYFFLGILILFLIEGVNGAKRAYYCRDGWMRYNNACYLFINSEADNWTDAYTHCNILHGYLADILSEDENNFIKANLHSRHESGCFYISATDVELEGHWIWANSDDPVQYKDWAPSEPQNVGSGENCICLHSNRAFKWIDLSCDAKMPFICKMKLTDPDTEVIG